MQYTDELPKKTVQLLAAIHYVLLLVPLDQCVAEDNKLTYLKLFLDPWYFPSGIVTGKFPVPYPYYPIPIRLTLFVAVAKFVYAEFSTQPVLVYSYLNVSASL